MFDYDLKNDGPVNVAFKDDAFRIGQLKLTGADTNLELSGGADAGRRVWNLSAKGGASLSILKLAFPDGHDVGIGDVERESRSARSIRQA